VRPPTRQTIIERGTAPRCSGGRWLPMLRLSCWSGERGGRCHGAGEGWQAACDTVTSLCRRAPVVASLQVRHAEPTHCITAAGNMPQAHPTAALLLPGCVHPTSQLQVHPPPSSTPVLHIHSMCGSNAGSFPRHGTTPQAQRAGAMMVDVTTMSAAARSEHMQ
jgi:hypothetical protein